MRKYKKVLDLKRKDMGTIHKILLTMQLLQFVEECQFNIPNSTLHCKLKGIKMRPIGHPPSLSPEEEKSFVKHLIVVAEWGFFKSRLTLDGEKPIWIKLTAE